MNQTRSVLLREVISLYLLVLMLRRLKTWCCCSHFTTIRGHAKKSTEKKGAQPGKGKLGHEMTKTAPCQFEDTPHT